MAFNYNRFRGLSIEKWPPVRAVATKNAFLSMRHPMPAQFLRRIRSMDRNSTAKQDRCPNCRTGAVVAMNVFPAGIQEDSPGLVSDASLQFQRDCVRRVSALRHGFGRTGMLQRNQPGGC